MKLSRARVFFINPCFTGVSFNNTQMVQFKSAFRKFDHFSGDDGEVNKEEVVAILDHLGLRVDAERVEKGMAAVDHDGNRSLNFSEFIKFLKSFAEQHHIQSEVSMDQFSYEGFGMVFFPSLRSGNSKNMDVRMGGLEDKFSAILNLVQGAE